MPFGKFIISLFALLPCWWLNSNLLFVNAFLYSNGWYLYCSRYLKFVQLIIFISRILNTLLSAYIYLHVTLFAFWVSPYWSQQMNFITVEKTCFDTLTSLSFKLDEMLEKRVKLFYWVIYQFAVSSKG